jgi:plastocyanin
MTAPASDRPATPARRRAVAATAMAAALAFGLAACGGGGDDDTAQGDVSTAPTTTAPAPTTTPATTGPSPGTGSVLYEVTALEYTDVSAPAGATIEVANISGAAHTFTAEDGSFDVAYAASEAARVEVPAEPGEYPFFCDIHPAMEATLTVS